MSDLEVFVPGAVAREWWLNAACDISMEQAARAAAAAEAAITAAQMGCTPRYIWARPDAPFPHDWIVHYTLVPCPTPWWRSGESVALAVALAVAVPVILWSLLQ